MDAVTKRELNQNTAAVLARVTKGGDAVVTERGVPKWRISAYRPTETTLNHLEREGRYTPPASDPRPWPREAPGPTHTDDSVSALLDEIKGDH